MNDLSSAYFGFVEITFENISADWVRLSRMDLDFGGPIPNEGMFVPWGTDIDSWRLAIQQRGAIREANALAALTLVAVGGAVLHAAAPRKPAGIAGGAVAAGALAALIVKQSAERAERAESTAPFPETHLLAVPFAVPPGLFSKRWIVLNTRPRQGMGCVRSMLLDYETDRGVRERALLEFKPARSHSEWQSDTCDVASDRRASLP